MIEIPTPVLIDPEKLKSDGKNPNVMTEGQHKALRKNMEKYGFLIPIITNQELVIADGEQRWTVAKAMGLKEVPVVQLELEEVDRRILRQVMNKLKGQHDLELDIREYERIISDSGLKSLGELLDVNPIKFERLIEQSKQAEEDGFTPSPEAKYKIERGEVWQLGKHTLMCGDSTNKQDVDKLLQGHSIDMVFTDPPYNIDYQDVKHKFDKMEGDKQTKRQFTTFIQQFLVHLKTPLYLCCNWQAYPQFYDELEKAGLNPKSCIVWDKERGVQNLDKYHKQHEFIIYAGPFGGEKTLGGDIWKLKREKNEFHPTQKPISLVDRAIVDSSQKGDTILDLFGGSGSTLIACETRHRKCKMMEIDPYYCSVIIERWERLTGKEATREYQNGV